MPEGDSLRHVEARLRPLLVGRPLRALYDHGLPRTRFSGAIVRGVVARGKHLLVEVADVGVIHVHFRIYGKTWVERADAVTPRQLAAASLALVTDEHAVLFRHTPVVELLASAFVHAHPQLARLGPDLSDETVDLDVVCARARAPELARKTIAEVLLDQRVACGVGNVYKSEVLFLERVDPFVATAAVSDDVLRRLFATAHRLLRENRAPGRRTTTFDRSAGGRPLPGRGRLFVYRRTGRGCFECGDVIRARVVGDAARTTWYCPTCQSTAGLPARPV